MKNLLYILFALQSAIVIAQPKTGLSPYGEKINFNPYASNGITANSGFTQLSGALTKSSTIISTNAENTLAISGLPFSGDKNDMIMVATTDGTLKKSSFPPINIVPSDRGTVMAINGKLEVAQEIAALMSETMIILTNNNTVPFAITNLTNILIDNKNALISNNTTNSFTVTTTGVYSVNINASLLNADSSLVNTVIGIWDDIGGNWVARIGVQRPYTKRPITLITAITLDALKTYSFRVSNGGTGPLTLEASNAGTVTAEGSGPVGFFSIRRLK